MAIIKLNEVQRGRVLRLETQLKKATKKCDLASARLIINDLQPIYSSTGNVTRLNQAKTRFYESAMECGELTMAQEGFESVRQRTNAKTRTFLEATSLLAICFLRQSFIDKAEPLIKEVLTNDSVIKSQKKRELFRKLAIERFEEETLLFALKSHKMEPLNLDRIQKEAEDLLAKKGKNEILQHIGYSIPSTVKDLLLHLDDFSKKQLPSAERLRLPSPKEVIKDDNIGRTFFSSIKKVLYKLLCDSESNIYTTWFDKGAECVESKAFIINAVSQTFIQISIGIKVLIVSVVALVIKLGVRDYCANHKPIEIMDLR